MRTVSVLPLLRTAAFDRALTYALPDDAEVAVGDVVRVPLGARAVFGYVLSSPQVAPAHEDGLRFVLARIEGSRAFDEEGLGLAAWVAQHYCCSLGEALGALVVGGTLPRVVERLVPKQRPREGRFGAVPQRLVRLVWDDLGDGFSLEQLLRHPEARRAGDRRALMAAVSTLVRAGAIERVRLHEVARMREGVDRVLEAAAADAARGPRVRALVELVREAGRLRRADAVHAGFSAAIITRAVKLGALREVERPPVRRPGPSAGSPGLVPTAEQRAALVSLAAALERGTFAEVLLAGVTGSGKTLVYIETIARVVAAGGSAIVLVPEISLTPQTARRFEQAFGDAVTVLHSALSERERFERWQQAARGEKRIVVGARSAVFAPLVGVRLIVVDEAHESSYKQDATPRYHAVDVARERMRRAGGLLILGTATPALESLVAVARGESRRIVLAKRATDLPLPAVRVVDMRAEFERGNRRIFSTALVEGIERRLAAGEKIVLFVNRRGSASFALCRACGYVPECERCSLALTVHRAESLLRCHLCDAQAPLPNACPRCAGPMREFGVGTQRVVETVATLFPAARVVRMDSDTTTRVGDHARLLTEFAERADVLVGTQMVAKGLDFPTVTLAGVVAADVGLHLPDFRAAERTFALLTQVAGRSGRARPGEAIVQTYSAQHPAIVFAARHDFEGFAERELAEREALRYPPFASLVYLGVIARKRHDAEAAAQRYATALRSLEGVEVLGPAPYPIPRVNGEWRYRVAVKAADATAARAFIREHLAPLARTDRATRLIVNVDP